MFSSLHFHNVLIRTLLQRGRLLLQKTAFLVWITPMNFSESWKCLQCVLKQKCRSLVLFTSELSTWISLASEMHQLLVAFLLLLSLTDLVASQTVISSSCSVLSTITQTATVPYNASVGKQQLFYLKVNQRCFQKPLSLCIHLCRIDCYYVFRSVCFAAFHRKWQCKLQLLQDWFQHFGCSVIVTESDEPRGHFSCQMQRQQRLYFVRHNRR